MGLIKSAYSAQNALGCQAREQVGDAVEGREEAARPITSFEVDARTSRMTEYELALIRRYYHVLDYVQFRLTGPTDVPTWPPPSFIAVYRDYFIRGFRLPLHPFIKEVLLNLEISLPQLNPNAVQCIVALWALYRMLGFPDMTVEELRVAYSVKNTLNCDGSYYFQSFKGRVITDRDDNMKTWKNFWFWARVRGRGTHVSWRSLGGLCRPRGTWEGNVLTRP